MNRTNNWICQNCDKKYAVVKNMRQNHERLTPKIKERMKQVTRHCDFQCCKKEVKNTCMGLQLKDLVNRPVSLPLMMYCYK